LLLQDGGYHWIRQNLSANDIAALRSVFIAKNNQRLILANQSGEFRAALWNITQCVRSVMPEAKPVRAIAFNKSHDENWAVSWHQDRIISVREKKNTEGYSNWSRKAGVWHCEPPLDILEKILAVRIHLDDATDQTGALEILEASHKFGKVTADKTKSTIKQCKPIMCEAQTGDILIMKMLMLHRSKPSLSARPRRAIRLDYSAVNLPTPLNWETD